MHRRLGVRLNILIKRALRNAPPAEAERIKRALREGRVAEVLPELVKLAERDGPLDIYYASESRFVPVEEQEEVVEEVEEVVAEEEVEVVGDVEEQVEDNEYLGQHIVKKAFPEKAELTRRPSLRGRI
jgi:hypothetical protein